MMESLGHGFTDHGVASPISNHRGTVATVDGTGRNVVLVWLFDHRGGYAQLVIDAQTGQSWEIPTPFPTGGDCPFASLLSSRNRYYTHFNGHFAEFDPNSRTFTFSGPTVPQMAMSMTEDDAGRIWLASYPDSGLACFDPHTRQLTDYGHLYAQNWRQYQRSIATDDAGWVYFAIGNTASQIIVFDPSTRRATPVLAEAERVQGTAYVYRDLNGCVYGSAGPGTGQWYEFMGGESKKIAAPPEKHEKPVITGSQGLFHRAFPDGSRLVECDLVERKLVVEDANHQTTTVPFTYTSEGAHLMGVARAPDGTVCGGTAFPMRFFSYDPRADRWTNRVGYGQWNTVTATADRFFVGGYTGGFLLEWDPAQPWVPTEKGRTDGNPRFLTECNPSINRPHGLLACPDGQTIILAGTPDYGYTGGGLLKWDRKTGTGTLVPHTELIPEHSTMALFALPDGKLLAGTTIDAGTGGMRKATEAELYILDLATMKIEWHAALIPGVPEYNSFWAAADGLVYGIAERGRFFVFDPRRKALVHEREIVKEFGLASGYQQGPRNFVADAAGQVYLLLVKGIARIDPKTYALSLIAESPVPIQAAGTYCDGRIYFGSGSHLYSYAVG